MAVRRRRGGRARHVARPKKNHKRAGRARRAHKLKKAKKGKPRGRSRSAKKGATLSRGKLLDILTVPNTLTRQVADACAMPTSNNTVGVLCNYFHEEGSNFPGNGLGYTAGASCWPAMSCSPSEMLVIGAAIDSAANPALKFFQTDFKMKHQISNCGNVDVMITGYLCESRHDQNNNAYNYPLNRLGNGFLNTGTGTSSQYNNVGLNNPALSPFNAIDFIEEWKIIRTDRRRLKAGRTTEYNIRDMKKHVIHPNRFIQMNSTQGYASGTIQITISQGSRFWLFKVERGQITDDKLSAHDIEAWTTAVNMLSNFMYQYKYINDNNSDNLNLTEIGVVAGVNTDAFMNAYTGIPGVVQNA